MKITIIRTDGKHETHETTRTSAIGDVGRLINAECLDTVNLRDGRVMLIDDNGYEVREVRHGPGVTPLGLRYDSKIVLVPTVARKPVNPEATRLYHAICKPGTTHQIVGDVAIALDADFEEAA